MVQLTMCDPDSLRKTRVPEDGRVYLGDFKGREVRLAIELVPDNVEDEPTPDARA